MPIPGQVPKIYDVWSDLVEFARRGLPKHVAAAKCGISPNTSYAWMKRGEEEHAYQEQVEQDPSAASDQPDTYEDGIRRARIYGDFYVAMIQAQAERQLECVEGILTAGRDPKQWGALAWYLERTDPETYGRKDSISVRGGSARNPDGLVSPDRQEELANAVLQQTRLLRARAITVIPSTAASSSTPTDGGGKDA